MSLQNLLLMRHELLLSAAALLILMAEIFMDQASKKTKTLFPIVLFAIITIAGFLPVSFQGPMFGGMYTSSALTSLMKNILNIGVLLVLIQSVTWLNKDENSDRISEYFILILSTLIGMDFMISWSISQTRIPTGYSPLTSTLIRAV